MVVKILSLLFLTIGKFWQKMAINERWVFRNQNIFASFVGVFDKRILISADVFVRNWKSSNCKRLKFLIYWYPSNIFWQNNASKTWLWKWTLFQIYFSSEAPLIDTL